MIFFELFKFYLFSVFLYQIHNCDGYGCMIVVNFSQMVILQSRRNFYSMYLERVKNGLNLLYFWTLHIFLKSKLITMLWYWNRKFILMILFLLIIYLWNIFFHNRALKKIIQKKDWCNLGFRKLYIMPKYVAGYERNLINFYFCLCMCLH